MNMNAFNAQMSQLFFWVTVGEIALAAIGLWLLYLMTKMAIRDGIKESGIIEALRAPNAPAWTVRNPMDQSATTRPMHLPEMKAD